MAKKTVWDLALNISGKGTEASQAIRTVKKQLDDLKGAADQLGKDWKAFTGNATKLALGFTGGVAAATAGVVSMANSFAAAGDKAAKTSAALGIGVEAYQELTYAMGQSGLSAQEFDTALQKFNLTVRQGAVGNEAMQKQLLAVGLSAQKLAGMKPEQAMERLSDYMQSLPNDAKRTQAAVALFGKTAGPKMMAAMKQGSEGLRQLSQEARDLGIVISDEQAKQSVAYGSALTRLKESVTGMKNQFIGSAIGPLTEAFDHLKKAIVEQMPAIQELGRNFGLWLGETVKRLPEIIEKIKEFAANVWDNVNKVKDFVGGWKNLSKILAGLAVAPTLISGLKTVFSFGKLISIAMKGLPLIMSKMGLAAVPISGALLPIIGIIAGIALVIYTVVKNFDTLKQYALDCIERIKSAFSDATGGMAVDWQKVGEVAKNILGIIMSILEGGVLFVIKTVMNAITSAIQIIIGAFKVLWNVLKLIFWPWETIIKVIIGLFTGGFTGALDALKGQFTKLGEIFNGIWDGIKIYIQGFVDFFKNIFKDAIDFVGGLFGKTGEKVGTVVSAVKGFFDGGKKVDIVGHASGGIFTQPHIAEIAEKGAEAIVPLNNTSQGFDIWKQAGELGGYVKTASEQSPAISAAASVSAATPSIKTPESSPVMAAAAQRISSGDTVVNVEFKMTNNFNGGTPDSNTASQISAAGEQARNDFESKVKSIFDSIMRDRMRLSYG
jgi:hypothetical protein